MFVGRVLRVALSASSKRAAKASSPALARSLTSLSTSTSASSATLPAALALSLSHSHSQSQSLSLSLGSGGARRGVVTEADGTQAPGATVAHGGKLLNLVAAGEELAKIKAESMGLASFTLNDQQLCDVELLLNGGMSPLDGFMNEKDYDSVVQTMRLANGVLFPLPITLDVPAALVEGENKTFVEGAAVALRDAEGDLLAILDVASVYQPNREIEAQMVYGTTDEAHPGVAYLMTQTKPYYVGGRLRGAQLPIHYDYKEHRETPYSLRREFDNRGWRKIVGFHSRNPMHRAHFEMTMRAAHSLGSALLINPVAGAPLPGEIDHHTRVKCYQEVLPRYPSGMAMMNLLPFSMRMGGPREAVVHAIIRKNYGCTDFIVGVYHAGTGQNEKGADFYAPHASVELCKKFEDEIGIGIHGFKRMVYVSEKDHFYPVDQLPSGATPMMISGAELRRRLFAGEGIPEWFTFPRVLKHLQRAHPTHRNMGVTLFFTGFSGSGKSTVANAVYVLMQQEGSRRVTLLDGDVVRTNLSSELGFSKEHRDLNIRRIGYVASEINKNGGAAICAPIAPFAQARRHARADSEQYGAFIEVWISTPISTCEKRDRKGLYAKARAGLLKGMTGIDDPYEEPKNPELDIDTTNISVEDAAKKVMDYLRSNGYIEDSTKKPGPAAVDVASD